MFPKILNLVIYSDNEIYNEMYNLTSLYYSNFSNIDTYYICKIYLFLLILQ